jgi:thymidine kinase
MSINIIYGCMFAKKTGTLIEIANSSHLAKIIAIKPVIDNRYAVDNNHYITSHDGKRFPAISYHSLLAIPEEKLANAEIILIDESQFFHDLVEFANKYKTEGKTLYIAGLDLTHQKKPFGQMIQILDIADKATKLSAICNCGDQACYTARKNHLINPNQIHQINIIGGQDIYYPVCEKCYPEQIDN